MTKEELEIEERLHRMKMERAKSRRDFLVQVGPGLSILIAWTLFLTYRMFLEMRILG